MIEATSPSLTAISKGIMYDSCRVRSSTVVCSVIRLVSCSLAT